VRKTKTRDDTTKGTEVTGVVFELPADAATSTVHLCGEFNEWSTTATPMAREDDGVWRTTLDLEPGRAYRFRYILDDERWENDWAADAYVENPYGSDDSVVVP
jgi:1,4-alpha-glucan branching enzyme